MQTVSGVLDIGDNGVSLQLIALDTGPLRLVTHPRPSTEAANCSAWVAASQEAEKRQNEQEEAAKRQEMALSEAEATRFDALWDTLE